MLEFLRVASLVAATVTMGLTAGLLFGYACSVMPALAHADDRTFIDVMRRVNAAIQNGWFALSFVGALVFTGAAAALHIGRDTPTLVVIATALVLYAATLGITLRVNIPLNNQLDAAGQGASAAARASFEVPWVRAHLIRTLTAIAGFGLLCGAILIAP